MKIHLDESLEDAKAWLESRLDRGVNCPCCGQYAKRYRRSMSVYTAKAMIAMANHYDINEYVHMPTLIRDYLPDLTQGGYATLGKYWDLITEESARRPDGGRSGWWKLTVRGIEFLKDFGREQKYAVVYDGKLEGYEGKRVGISDVLKEPFDYRDLMIR